MLELDEQWSFVSYKANDIWLWLAICRRTLQVVGHAVGKRTIETCRRLWASIPPAYRTKRCFTDFWQAYAVVVPARLHRPTDKGDGQTCHIGADLPHRALQQHAAPASGSADSKDALVFQV